MPGKTRSQIPGGYNYYGGDDMLVLYYTYYPIVSFDGELEFEYVDDNNLKISWPSPFPFTYAHIQSRLNLFP